MTPQERIKADAKRVYPVSWQYQERIGYIAGATAEHDRAQVLVDALEAVKRKLNWIENADELEIIRKALGQWKGKEVGDA